MWKMSNHKLYIDKMGFEKKYIKKNKFIYMGEKKLSKSDWAISMGYSDIY